MDETIYVILKVLFDFALEVWFSIVAAFVLVRGLGFLRLNLTCPMDTRAIVYKALFGPRFRVCKDCFDSLSDRRSDERCEGAGKTACELLYSRVVLVSWDLSCLELQGLQKQASLTLFLLPLKQPGNHLSKRVHVRASGVPVHMGVAARVLTWTVSA